jgi:small subunit ribosomal protein S16
MATRIRLRRTGRRHQPSYRIVVTDKAAPRDGRFIATLGHYNPRTDPETLEVDAAKARDWLSRGATASETVRSLFKRAGVFAPGAADGAAAPAAAQGAAADATASPSDATPTEAAPADATPTEAAPADATPTEAVPADATPTESAPADADTKE